MIGSLLYLCASKPDIVLQVLQLKPLLLPSQKGVAKSLLYHLEYGDRIIQVVHRIIRFTIISRNSAKDLEVLLSVTCRIIRFSRIGLSDLQKIFARTAEMAKDLKRKVSGVCRIIRWFWIGLSNGIFSLEK